MKLRKITLAALALLSAGVLAAGGMHMDDKDIERLVSELTLEEKAALTSGADFWNTAAIDRAGIPSISISDGPNGIRKQDGSGRMGLHESEQSISFPSGSLAACSFDREIISLMGRTLGKEARAEDVDILLGPSMNIKRSPLDGRNQEYYSEDPYLSGELAGAYVDGLQSTGTLSCVKHFYGNNMEERRLTTSSEIDERTRREIYLSGFERLIRNHKPASIMSSYNKVNGTYVSESYEALTGILRDEWGFEGFVMSDWGAVNDRAKDLAAGLDLEMPYSYGSGPDAIIKAVREGTLAEEVLDLSCRRILTAVFRAQEKESVSPEEYDWESDHQIARKIASESMVLLKNEDSVLPLNKSGKIAFIGEYAAMPRCLGGGSSHVTAYRISSALEAAEGLAEITYARGFDDSLGKTDTALVSEAQTVAASADVAVLFIGLPDGAESEGFDRSDLSLPSYQNELVEAVLEVQENVIVVLHGGGAVEMPWADKVKGIIEAYLAGEAVGEAECDVLFGAVNPSGRLAESFPLRLEDNPSYLSFRPVNGKVVYSEGVFVGYRYYESVGREVLFPFGHGLSYTTFDYSDLKVSRNMLSAGDEELTVTVTVENTGAVSGAEVVQLYISPAEAPVERPLRELKGFDKVYLEPGEKQRVSFTLTRRDFSYWDVIEEGWYAPTGEYKVQICRNASEVAAEVPVQIESAPRKMTVITRDTAIGDLSEEQIAIVMAPFIARNGGSVGDQSVSAKASSSLQVNMPLRSLVAFGAMDEAGLQQLLEELNGNIDREK